MFITKKNLKDWRLWYKLAAALIIIVFVMELLIKGLINIETSTYKWEGQDLPRWAIYSDSVEKNIIGYDYEGYIINYFSFFTIQSNILVAIWFIVGFIKHDKEGETKILSKAFSLSVITYITVTALIFNGMLLPQLIATTGGAGLGAVWWIEQMVLHTIGPIATIVYLLFFMKIDLQLNFKKFITVDFFKMAIYPVFYLIFTLIRGELIYRSLGSNALLANKKGAYPYFFLEIHNKQVFGESVGPNFITNGLVWMFMAIIIIVLIVIGLGSLYLYVGSKTEKIREGIINGKERKQSE